MRKPTSILLAIAMLLSVLSALTFTVSAEGDEEFTAVNLSLGYNIGITYYTNIDYASDVTAHITINGRTDTVKATNTAGKASFSFNGIAPHELGATITAEVYKGDISTGLSNETTIKDICALYLNNTFPMYEEETRDGIHKLVSNLLQYGEYARVYKGVSGSIITDITSPNYAPDALETPTGEKTTGSGNASLSLKGLSVFFDTTNRYYIKFAAADISKVRFTVGGITYTEFGEEGGYYYFYTNPISAKDISNAVNIKGYYDGTKTIDLSYSVEQYVIDLAASSAGENMQNLAKATRSYGGSAEEYSSLNFKTTFTYEFESAHAGEERPASFTYGDYEYSYNQYWSGSKWVNYASQNGWGVHVLDTSKSSYGEILSSAYGEPVTNMQCTFSNCTSLTTAPAIPSSVTNMYGTFYNCTSLTTAPAIPSGITDMSSTFQGCTSLTTAPEIPNGVIYMEDTFEECTALTGTIIINANPMYCTSCFFGTTQPITIAGSCSDATKTNLRATANNGNVTVSH